MTTRMYTEPVDQTQWKVGTDGVTTFNWEYDEMRSAAEPVREGQGQAVEHLEAPGLVNRRRPRIARQRSRLLHPHLRFGHLGADDRAGAVPAAPPHDGVAQLAIPARRAGRAGVHCPDRAERSG